MKYANLVSKDGVKIGVKTVSSQVYNSDGTTIEDTIQQLKKYNINIINITIKPSDWQGGITAYMEAVVNNINFKSGSIVHVSISDIAAIPVLNSIGFQFNIYTVSDGSIIFYSDKTASANIDLQLLIISPKS